MGSQPQFKNSEVRRAARLPFPATIQFRAGNRRATLEVRDISQFGARIGGVYMVHVGDILWVKLDKLAAIEAKVVWFNDFEFGCNFTWPLNEAVLEAILRNP